MQLDKGDVNTVNFKTDNKRINQSVKLGEKIDKIKKKLKKGDSNYQNVKINKLPLANINKENIDKYQENFHSNRTHDSLIKNSRGFNTTRSRNEDTKTEFFLERSKKLQLER